MDAKALAQRVGQLHAAGYRLLLINGTSVLPGPGAEEGAVELTWSFERGGQLEHYRDRAAPGEEVPSVGWAYRSAFLYENELAELFGVNVTGRTVDFHGQLYQTAEKVPMSPKAIKARLEAAKGTKP